MANSVATKNAVKAINTAIKIKFMVVNEQPYESKTYTSQ